MARMRCRLSLAALPILLCATSAWGQTQILQGNIPFPFHVGEKHFAAGDYDVRIGDPFRATVTVVSRTDVEDLVYVHFFGDQNHDRSALQSKLVFNKYGNNEYFLSQIWHPFFANSLKVLKSDHEVVTSRLITGLRPEKVVIWAAVRLP